MRKVLTVALGAALRGLASKCWVELGAQKCKINCTIAAKTLPFNVPRSVSFGALAVFCLVSCLLESDSITRSHHELMARKPRGSARQTD